jgi:hypothetical protein
MPVVGRVEFEHGFLVHVVAEQCTGQTEDARGFTDAWWALDASQTCR